MPSNSMTALKKNFVEVWVLNEVQSNGVCVKQPTQLINGLSPHCY